MNEEIKKKFMENVIAEYTRDTDMSRFCSIKFTKNTDGTFVQIGLRPQLQKEIFEENKAYYPNLIGLGTSIANGEIQTFIKNLLSINSKNEIKKEEVNSRLIYNTIKKIKTFDENTKIIAPLNIRDYLLEKTNLIKLDEEILTYLIDNIKISFLPINFIGNNIIIYNKKQVFWTYKLNEEGNQIHLDIKPSQDPAKIDVLARVIIKQEILDKELTILKIKD